MTRKRLSCPEVAELEKRNLVNVNTAKVSLHKQGCERVLSHRVPNQHIKDGYIKLFIRTEASSTHLVKKMSNHVKACDVKHSKVRGFFQSSARATKQICYLTLLALFITGCSASSQSPEVTQPVMQSMTYREPVPQYSNPGSIYSANTYRSLYEDGRARRVGDIVVVNISETSSASQTANTTTSRESDKSGGISSLFGFSKLGVGAFSVPLGSDMLGLSSQSDFTGDGSTSRDNTVTASIAARVINVLSNGNLEIEGVREIKVNAETQFMVVSGIVRTRDISASNTISSTQIANAKIEYYGEGVLSAKQKPGWLVRLLDFLSPF